LVDEESALLCQVKTFWRDSDLREVKDREICELYNTEEKACNMNEIVIEYL